MESDCKLSPVKYTVIAFSFLMGAEPFISSRSVFTPLPVVSACLSIPSTRGSGTYYHSYNNIGLNYIN